MKPTLLDVRIRWARATLELARARSSGALTAETAGRAAEVNELERQWLTESALTVLERFAIGPDEERVLNLLVAVGMDPQAQALAVQLWGAPDPTLGMVRSALFPRTPERGNEVLGPRGTLRRFDLVERSELDERTHETRQTWAVAPRVLDALVRGAATAIPLDSSLAPLVTERVPAILDDLVVGGDVVGELRRALVTNHAFLYLHGAQGSGRRSLLTSLASTEGRRVIELDVSRLSRDAHACRRELCRVAREAQLLGASLLLANIDTMCGAGEGASPQLIADVLSGLDGPVLATGSAPRLSMRWSSPVIAVQMPRLRTDQRAKVWGQYLGAGTESDARQLASQYPLEPALVHRAVKSAKARAHARSLNADDIYAGIRSVLDDKLGDYARRVEVTQTWEDIVLPQDQLEQIEYLIARIRQRRTVYEQWGFAAKVGKGLGTTALFSGPPGTGKTMLAALIAKELGLELYQVDMAKVTSKFIGETERNLAALFDAAEAGHAILLFDEADSLFGKRTDVKSSNDRYANLETNYLLQRLESFTGICLLTSNHESNIDPAFQRRMSLHLRFELPDVEERAALWEAMLPAAAPVEGAVDFAALARKYSMSGGYIRNAALRAAFLAADEGSSITGAHLERAARAEYEGMGKIAA